MEEGKGGERRRRHRRADRSCAPRPRASRDATASEDSHRFGRLILPHLKQAYVLARWMTGDRLGAATVVQQACMRGLCMTAEVSDCDARLDPCGRAHVAAAWLGKYRPVAFVPADEFGPSEHADAILGFGWPVGRDDPHRQADAASLETGLPARFRTALVMRDIWRLCYREIAQRTFAPIGTVMSRLARGRDRLIEAAERQAG